ncbi:TIGR00297 family protein [Candidatus Methanoperedens nitroreducens]|uniref:TIGR00297 family protein n=1 Tax=Candidatus Methanoperedens nitratireducens TaxID=1392998 RepID=A0A062V1R0_9EURY|nr:TIGR00297 family protein [Candidatus Methanoperedens nitroreducens]KCZ70563.1 TIGR00297 family protein [Candidatus Methanoperedens nitroreducens]MDJ1420414.1 TIGR00297 family protein [Candidatus Methanoperedens sp.]
MNIIQEYKRQSIYILLGSIAFLFPFFDISYFLLAFFGGALLLSRISPRSSVFTILAREPDIKAGKLVGLIHLFFTMASLFLIGLIFELDNFPLFIIGAAFAITTFGDGIADIINIHDKAKNNKNQNDIKICSAKSSIVFLISGSVYAFLIGIWISDFTLNESYSMIFFLAVIGAITGAFLESITVAEDNITIPLGSAMTMWLFYAFSYTYDVGILYLIKVLVFAFVLGYLAYRVRIADISAMLSATLLGVVIIISSDVFWFFILLAFFLLGGLFTRYKYSYKLAYGTAEAKGGVRGYKNVFSNSLAALSLAVAYKVFPSHGLILLSAYLGSIATATGDTLASEIGQTYRGEPRMITTLKKTRTGVDGAVSTLGEMAALFGAGVIALLSFLLIQQDTGIIIAVIAGGFIGTNIDSVLGATLQQRGYLTNNGVNLMATISGAIVSGMIYSAGS